MVNFQAEQGTAFIKAYYVKHYRAHNNEKRMLTEFIQKVTESHIEFEPYLIEPQQQLKREVQRLIAALKSQQANTRDKKQCSCQRGHERSRSRQKKKSIKETMTEDVRTTVKELSKNQGLEIKTIQKWL